MAFLRAPVPIVISAKLQDSLYSRRGAGELDYRGTNSRKKPIPHLSFSWRFGASCRNKSVNVEMASGLRQQRGLFLALPRAADLCQFEF